MANPGRKRPELLNQIFGKLTVIKFNDIKTRQHTWLCKCECGNYAIVRGDLLIKGATQSCGCAHRMNTSGRNQWKWNNGRMIKDGYVLLKKKNHLNSDKAGYVREHHIVMSKHIGRPIKRGETVHHKNGDKKDNRIDNLELWVSRHPKGQRVSDMVEFCIKYLKDYAPETLK